MSGSYRSLIVAACGLTIAASLGIGAYVGSLYAPSHKQYQAVSAQQSAQQDYNGPSQSLPDIAAVPGPVERAIANPPPATGQDHEKRDLAAQEASAAWAFWMVLASYFSAIVTTIGTIFLYKQIKLTQEAVKDTGDATTAMVDANNIAKESSRAWVSLSVEPEQIKADIRGGIYFRINFIAENIGQTAATHFDLEHAVFFQGQHESGESLSRRITEQVEDWIVEHEAPANYMLIPRDKEIASWWDTVWSPDFEWLDGPLTGMRMAKPIFLAAAFYRTVNRPDLVQVSWRAWYIHSFHPDGHVASWIPYSTKTLGPKDLCAAPFKTSLVHAFFKAPKAQED